MATVLQRSIELGDAEVVIVRAGGDCTVRGYDGDRVLAESESRWGMNVRIVVRVDRFELFRGEWSARPDTNVKTSDDAVEVNAGGSCVVQVPVNSAVKVYAGKHASVVGVRGPVVINAGGNVRVSDVNLLEPCNCGGTMDIDCERLTRGDAKFSAGKDIHILVRTLADARVNVNDAGGYWEGEIGNGRATLRLKCGGVARLVTDKAVRGRVLGHIEKPA